MTWIPQFCSLDTHRSAKLVVPSLIDRSLPQDSDTLRFVQQCLGGMGFSISARRAVDRKSWVFYKSHGSCLGVADSHNKYCGYWKHLALWHTLIITYTGYWSYIPLHGNDWRSSWVVLPYGNAWSDAADVTGPMVKWRSRTKKTFLCHAILDSCTHIAWYYTCIYLVYIYK